jgi:histidinol-phosphate aminotransferase
MRLAILAPLSQGLKMSQYWSHGIGALRPYIPGEQPAIDNIVKLNTNENPFGPSPLVFDAIRSVATDSLRLYPDPEATELKATLAAYHGLDPREVFVGNGSDEVLALTFLALLKHDAPLLFPDVTYSFYPVYCKLYGIDFRQIPLTDSMEIRLEDYDQQCSGIIFPNPNAPTGIGLPLAAVEDLLVRRPDAVVVVDEAYVDFGGESALPLIQSHPNLLIIRTFSKSRSLAGLRIGFAAGHANLIEALDRVKNSFNSYPVDRVALAAAIASYRDERYFRRTCAAIVKIRSALMLRLSAFGFDVLPSVANFVFARHPRFDAAMLAKRLHERSIVVRHFEQPRIREYLRITVGTPSNCRSLIDALSEITTQGRVD